jgi:two-component system LytT family response regulator
MRVLIADDEPVARKGLRALLAAEPDVTVVGEAATGDDAERLLRTEDVDVLIVDIQMPRQSGLEVVAGIDPADLPIVIFVTAHDEHAIRAFELHALDYLVKPVREERFRQALARARAALGRGRSGRQRQRLGAFLASQSAFALRLRVEDRDRIRFVPVREIQWIEAQDYCVMLHLANESILRRGTLRQTLRSIDPREFVRVHRSAAVNVRHVRDLTLAPDGGLIARLTSGAEVRVVRQCRQELEARLAAMP